MRGPRRPHAMPAGSRPVVVRDAAVWATGEAVRLMVLYRVGRGSRDPSAKRTYAAGPAGASWARK
jgi:hypothetical protein